MTIRTCLRTILGVLLFCAAMVLISYFARAHAGEWPHDAFSCKAYRQDLVWRDWARRHCPGYRYLWHRRHRHRHGHRHGHRHVPRPDADVMAAQLRLRELGHDIDADGLMGPQTRRALRRFQRRHDLATTGELGRATKRALRRAQRRAGAIDEARDGYGHRAPRRCLSFSIPAYSSENVIQGSDSKESSKKEAKDRWSAVVRAEHGEIFMNWDHAAERFTRCWQSSTGERFTEKAAQKIGRVHWRCKVEARPCETPPKEPEGETEATAPGYEPEWVGPRGREGEGY